MKRRQLTFKKSWDVIKGTPRSQTAVMVINPGKSEGGPENKHNGDQWLYVISGKGEAVVNGKKLPLDENTLILIAQGEKHEIKNRGRKKLLTLNFYAPPQY